MGEAQGEEKGKILLVEFFYPEPSSAVYKLLCFPPGIEAGA